LGARIGREGSVGLVDNDTGENGLVREGANSEQPRNETTGKANFTGGHSSCLFDGERKKDSGEVKTGALVRVLLAGDGGRPWNSSVPDN